MSKGMKGNYLGFTYNGKHSSDFGITRTSDGSRFNQNLLPTIQDKAASVPGRAGAVLQSSTFGTKVFSVQFAYDSVTEENLQRISEWLGDKKIHPLVFDELPYKTWYAKVTGSATTKWIPFNEGENGRLYKGEGTIQFTCYEPFAHCNCNWTPTEDQEVFKDEWWLASRLGNVGLKKIRSGAATVFSIANNILTTTDGNKLSIADNLLALGSGTLQILNNLLMAAADSEVQTGHLSVYNCGDMPTDFKLIFTPRGENVDIPAGKLLLKNNNEVCGALLWKNIHYYPGDTQIVINGKMNLIEGMKAGKKSGNIYDEYIKDGFYFKLPTGQSELILEFDEDENGNDAVLESFLNAVEVKIDFDHLYF